MIIVCQECRKRYHVDAVALGDSGRRVRCAACNHVWFQEEDPLSRHCLFATEDLLPPKIKPLVQPTPSFLKSFWRLLKAFLWIFSLILAAGLVLGLLGGKKWVTHQIHQAKTLYETMVFSSVKKNHGLEIKQVKSHLVGDVWAGAREDGTKRSHYSFIIKGSILNTSNHVEKLPPLKIYLRGKCPPPKEGDDCLLQEWEHLLSQNQILPGDTLQFELSLKHRHPPGSTFSVDF